MTTKMGAYPPINSHRKQTDDIVAFKAVDMATSCLLLLSLAAMTVLVSAHRPLVVNRIHSDGHSTSNSNGNINLNDVERNIGSEQQTDDIRNAASAISASGGLTLGIVPIPIPGTNGGFQFQIGPIGFGGNWDLGLFPPGPLLSYSQPIVVSPYSPPSGPPSPSPATPSPYSYSQPIVISPHTPPSGPPSPSLATPSPYSYSQPIVISPLTPPSGPPSPSSAPPSPSSTPPTGAPSSYPNVQPYQQPQQPQQPGAYSSWPPVPQYVPIPIGGNVQGSFGNYIPYPPSGY